ncbi:MAG: hypothetical protein KAW46_12035 [candidate division Zixibacteria bacterium]|nr:hypothetical protein [candidate division Zixibacteria bacterium]
MKVAIPQLGPVIAPCFEAATTFFIASEVSGQLENIQTVKCIGSEGYRRVRLMRVHEVDTLICNGIKNLYRDMLVASGVRVISRISATVEQALADLRSGSLVASRQAPDSGDTVCDMPRRELLEWARRLFEQRGYVVTLVPGEDAFLIDMIAEISCPQCGRPVRVAICCGAHAYRSTIEITEFHHNTRLDYHARVYVSPSNPTIETCCHDYGIELVDPSVDGAMDVETGSRRLPILKGQIRDHERLSLP